jgi:hypothetical protein
LLIIAISAILTYTIAKTRYIGMSLHSDILSRFRANQSLNFEQEIPSNTVFYFKLNLCL